MKKYWIIMSALILGLFLFFYLKVFDSSFASAQNLTNKEAIELVQNRYQGVVSTIQHSKHKYMIKFEKEHDSYEIHLDEKSGEIILMKRINIKGGIPDPTQPLPDPNSPSPETPKKLTKNQAAEIALQQVPGTVDEIIFKVVNNQPYYLVKVKNNSEAIVQIQAITGKVMTVSWDDRNHSNDHKADFKNRDIDEDD